MHKIAIPDALVERVVARRGRVHLFDRLTGPSSALVVIDLQNAFMAPGMLLEIPMARQIVPNVNRLAAAIRNAGGKVVWIQMNVSGEEQRWSVFFDYFTRPESRAEEAAVLSPGHPGYELYAELEVEPGDLRVTKSRYSAFVGGSSDLDRRLRADGIDTVIIAGTLTNTCCESTARDAMMLNYKTVFVSDANATRSDEEHNATLANILRVFGDVRTAEEVISLLSPTDQDADGTDRKSMKGRVL